LVENDTKLGEVLFTDGKIRELWEVLYVLKVRFKVTLSLEIVCLTVLGEDIRNLQLLVYCDDFGNNSRLNVRKSKYFNFRVIPAPCHDIIKPKKKTGGFYLVSNKKQLKIFRNYLQSKNWKHKNLDPLYL
jgi:hypothetical protein